MGSGRPRDYFSEAVGQINRRQFDKLEETLELGHFGSVLIMSTTESLFYTFQYVKSVLLKDTVSPDLLHILYILYVFVFYSSRYCNEQKLRGPLEDILTSLSTSQLSLLECVVRKMCINTSDSRMNFELCNDRTSAIAKIEVLNKAGIVVFPIFGIGLFGIDYQAPCFGYHKRAKSFINKVRAVLISRGEDMNDFAQLPTEETTGCLVS